MDDGSESVQSFFSDDGEIESSLKKRKSDFVSIISEVELMEENKIQRAEIILNKILSSETVSIEDPSGFLHIEDKPMRVKVSTFLYNLQQPTKKIDLAVYTNILHDLKIPPHLVSNTDAKKVLNEFTAMRRKKRKPNKFKENQKNNKEANRAMEVKVKPPDQKLQNQKIKQTKRQSRRRKEKNGLTIKDVKLLDRLYSKGPASFGSSKRLKDFSKLPMTKVKMYLETKPSFTQYRAERLNFPRLKVIVNDLNEIWSLDLAHVDKLAKYNRDVKYLLVAVDCLSRYLRVEPLKTKNATETSKVFRNMIKHKQPQKVWVDDGTEFLGAFKTLCNKRGIHLYSTFSEKKSAFAERNIRSLKNIIYRYLEEKWTYSYINNLDQFVKTINSRVNRVTKLAPYKVNKNDVPRRASLTVETRRSQIKNQKLYVGDFVRIVKKEKTFRNGYKQSFTDEVFEIAGIPTLNPPTYSLIDSNKEIIQDKFYQPELQLVRKSPNQNE